MILMDYPKNGGPWRGPGIPLVPCDPRLPLRV
ncbi:rCG52392 [Rattus norvegicus]|uniref:RCG52392 n=1 Tax=Rattus norvegicus TaxID=10116 RepID=A6K0K6_RAT|nr:rCG52392 [Rattus norvegicus]